MTVLNVVRALNLTSICRLSIYHFVHSPLVLKHLLKPLEQIHCKPIDCSFQFILLKYLESVSDPG